MNETSGPQNVGRAMQQQVPPAWLEWLRGKCADLPETVEQSAWVGTRWRLRRQTVAHLLMIEDTWPPACAAAACQDGPLCVLTFRSDLPQAAVHAFSWEPSFIPRWCPDIVGIKLRQRNDWRVLEGLVRASYCRLAPVKLAAPVRASERRACETLRHALSCARNGAALRCKCSP